MTTSLRSITLLIMVGASLVGLAGPAAADSEEPKFRLLMEHLQEGSHDFAITTLSTRNDVVSGGNVLVRVEVARSIALGSVRVDVNGNDVTSVFREVAGSHALMGLVTGLVDGDNVLAASERTKRGKGPSGRLKVTNFPITGPIFSGPHETPFFCTTTTFNLPTTGGNLGQPLDADCSIATRIDYVYRSTNGTFKPLGQRRAAQPGADGHRDAPQQQRRQVHRARRDRNGESRHLSNRHQPRPVSRVRAGSVPSARGLEREAHLPARSRVPCRMVHAGDRHRRIV